MDNKEVDLEKLLILANVLGITLQVDIEGKLKKTLQDSKIDQSKSD